jgi:hypothetical protein
MEAGNPADQHRRYEEMAVAHVLGGLDESEGRDFRAHLLECPMCRARVGELRALAHDLADVERDERRVRAARATETKRRDHDQIDLGEGEPPRLMRPRILTVLGVAAILALLAWNVTLRESSTRVARDMTRSAEAASVLEFGTAGTVLQRAGTIRAQAKTDGGALVVLIDGLDDERLYVLYLVNADGRSVFRAPVRATDGRLFTLIDYPEGSERVLLMLPTDPASEELSGVKLFEATLLPEPPAPRAQPVVKAPAP